MPQLYFSLSEMNTLPSLCGKQKGTTFICDGQQVILHSQDGHGRRWHRTWECRPETLLLKGPSNLTKHCPGGWCQWDTVETETTTRMGPQNPRHPRLGHVGTQKDQAHQRQRNGRDESRTRESTRQRLEVDRPQIAQERQKSSHAATHVHKLEVKASKK